MECADTEEFHNHRVDGINLLYAHRDGGVLYNTERGSTIIASGHATRIVSLQRTRAASSKSELVSAPPGLVSDTKAVMMSDVQGQRHTMLVLDLKGSRHTPHVPMMEVLQNPRWVGSRQTISPRLVGLVAVSAARVF